MDISLLIGSSAVLGAVYCARLAKRRLELSKAKHPSLRGHSRMAKRLARLIPNFEYGVEEFFGVDGAPAAVAAQRRTGFERLARSFRSRFAKGKAENDSLRSAVSDMQFTAAYRVPFPFSRYVREQLPVPAVMLSAEGTQLTDLDGNVAFDLSGSYGVNVFGVDFYRSCIREATERADTLGPVLGYYHTSTSFNVTRLQEISQLDEVSFHMSGTEAVMQAVRLARYHTRRTHLVRFCGAYHGWWGDVQPGVGNPQRVRETYTLKDIDADTLHVLETRNDIACVLINPLQALHPNSDAPSDGQLLGSDRSARFDYAAYKAWLERLRDVCTRRSIVLIFDEVFLGFRLARGGAQEYFGVRADMVTYGKTLGGGLPVGVLCGKRQWMQRFYRERPLDICFARGTFNTHPYVMTAMQIFLERLETPEIQAIYASSESTWKRRAEMLNHRLTEAQIPVQVAHLSSIFTVLYSTPCRYNWMFQYYLREQGLALGWIGTGRFIFSLNYSEDEFAEVVKRILAAGLAMKADGFWWREDALTNRDLRQQVLKDLWRRGFRQTPPPSVRQLPPVPAEDARA